MTLGAIEMPTLLDTIEGPADLKRLSIPELEQLAAEIRERIVSTITATGGHLASNLGVVELTIALHRCFDSPRDKLVWDVGHQTYAHKLLTGRRERFPTIRQQGGLSGFTERTESPHDCFGAGHASTSVSAALGMAIARDLRGERHHVIAVIGDGAMTGGMAFEALNQAGHLGTRLIVVLNDNGMAISPSVGALSRVFSQRRLNWRYYRAKEEADHMLSHVPLGHEMRYLFRRVKKGLKGIIIPSMFWDEMGFTYIGPIDGHDIAELDTALHKAKGYFGKPIVVHVVTTKGKGHPGAEQDAIGFHGVSPRRSEGAAAEDAPSYSDIVGQTVLRIMREDPRVVAVTAAMIEGTGLTTAATELPSRVFDTGICEQHAVTMAAGLATGGYVPIVAVYSTFLQRAIDQVIHDVCLQGLPVVFAIDRAGIVGEDGKTHQGSFDLSYLGPIPNIVIAAPKDENELQHMLFTAVGAGRPVAIRYPKGRAQGVPLDGELHELAIGRGEQLREGNDVAIVAIGSTVAAALQAADALAERGVECSVLNARFAKPLDEALIVDAARRTGRIVTVEDNALRGGFGSAVVALLEDYAIPGLRTERIGLPDEFVEHGPRRALLAQYHLDAAGIAERIAGSFPELIPSMEAKSKR